MDFLFKPFIFLKKSMKIKHKFVHIVRQWQYVFLTLETLNIKKSQVGKFLIKIHLVTNYLGHTFF